MRLFATIVGVLLVLLATGVVDPDSFAHHRAEAGAPEDGGAGDSVHPQCAHCCVGHHLTLAPDAGPLPALAAGQRVSLSDSARLDRERACWIFHPPRA